MASVLKNEKENMNMKIQTKSFIPYILHINKRYLDNNKNEISSVVICMNN
jgi:hypothetical protein